MDRSIDDVVCEARAFRLAMREWAKGYATARRLERSPAKFGLEAARADLRRWSSRYFVPSVPRRATPGLCK